MSNIDQKPQLLGVKKVFGRDLYFYLMHITWPYLYLLIFTSYMFINLIFSAIYYMIPNSISDTSNIFNYFYFSVQSFSTIGYGHLTPTADLANLLVMIQTILGLIYTASITGIFFSKLSRPHSKIRFSKNLLITEFNGKKQLIFRIGNTRGNDIVQANIKVSALHQVETSEGEILREIIDIPITRKSTPFFRLTWTIRHELNNESFFKESERYQNFERLLITIIGHDSTFSNTIYDRHIYLPTDIIYNKRFKDILNNDLNNPTIDYLNFDSTVEIGK